MAPKFELSYRDESGEPAIWVAIVRTTEYAQARKFALHLHTRFHYTVCISLTDEAHTFIALWPSQITASPPNP